MKQTSSSAKSKTEWALLKSCSNSAKLSAEHPEADFKHIVRGLVRLALQRLPSKALAAKSARNEQFE